MKVTERLTRVGNDLIWEATVEDPGVSAEPWKMTPIVARLNANPPTPSWVSFRPASFASRTRRTCAAASGRSSQSR